MVHSIGANTLSNATRLSHNSVQGHHHSVAGVERFADEGNTRWSMSVGCLLDPESPAARYGRSGVVKRPILGSGMCLSEQGNTLYISDLHAPYQHRDALDFLYALENHYQFAQVFQVGDLYDHHRGSYHESEPDALNAEDEYEAAREFAHDLQDIFPDMVISCGNHDHIPQRKLKTVGLPVSMLSDYNQLYGTENTWKWCERHWHDTLGGFPIHVPMITNKRGRWDGVIPKS